MSLTEYLASRSNKAQVDTVQNFDIIRAALQKNADRGIAQNVSLLNVYRFING